MSYMKILIFGHGQLGGAYKEYFDAKPDKWQAEFAVGADIRDLVAVKKIIEEKKPEVVLNVAAQTNLDWCEQNQAECFAVNTLGADNVARACQEAGVYLVHMSSGCVQESKSVEETHKEEDIPNPLSFYSWAKVWAENLLQERAQKRGIAADMPAPLQVLILRPRQLLSGKIDPRNALAKMLTYDKFVDMPNSCSAIKDLLWATEELIKQRAIGVFNVVNPGVTSPYQIALLLKEIIKPEMNFSKVSKEELDRITLAKRINSVLSTEKLAAAGITLPEVHERLGEIISELKNSIETPEGRSILDTIQKETEAKLGLKT